jgi:hypothetical protein
MFEFIHELKKYQPRARVLGVRGLDRRRALGPARRDADALLAAVQL